MGLFDKVIGQSDKPLNATEGMTGVVLCAVAADGVVTPEEVQGLGASLGRMRAFKDMAPRQVNATFERVLKIMQSKGVDALLEQATAAVPADMRPTAFAIAADLLFADGEVDSSERKFLERIQHGLQVPEDLAVKIVEVVSIKNKG